MTTSHPLKLFFALLLLAAPARQVHPGLLGSWQFDSSDTVLPDSSGNGHTGNVLGSVLAMLPSVDPSLGSSYYFDAAGDGAVQIGNSGLGTLQNTYSVAGWVKPEVVAGVQRIFSAGRSLDGGGFGFGLNGAGLRHTTYAVKDYNQAATLPANAWSHLAVVLDASNAATFYVNGNVLGTITHTAPGNATADDFYIGRATPGSSFAPTEEYTGRIDDLRLYDHALTSGDVQTLATIPNLRGYWALDEAVASSAFDSSGFQAAGNAHGALVNGPTPGEASVHANFGTAYRFNGSNQEINLGNSLNSLTENFTVAAWINPDDLLNIQRVVSSSTGPGWGFGLNGNGLRFTTFGILDYDIAVTGGIQAGVWTHLAVTFDSAFDAEFFVNGSSIGTVPGNAPANAATGVYRIGSRNGENFAGLIDEVRLYDRVLTPDEISAIMQPVIVPEPGVAGLILLGAGLLFALRRSPV